MKSAYSSKILVTLYVLSQKIAIFLDNAVTTPNFYIKIPVFAVDSNWLLVYEMPLDCGGEGTDRVSRDALAFHLPLCMCSLSLPSLGITFV
jgi:hypothetical protein